MRVRGFSSLTFLLILSFVGACQQEEIKAPITERISGKSLESTPKQIEKAEATREVTEEEALKKLFGDDLNSGSKSSGDAISNEPVASNQEEPAETVYPKLTLNAKGYINVDGSRYGLKQTLITEMSNTEFRTNITAFNSDKGEVNSSLQKSKGITVYEQTTPEAMKKLVDEQGFHDSSYLLFANKVVASNGITYNFSKPVPVFPMPAKASRYKELDEGQKPQWDAEVTSSEGKKFHLKISVEKRVNMGGDYGIQITSKIPEDDGADGRIQEKFPIPLQATYGLDTQNRLIVQITTMNAYYLSQAGKRQSFFLTHKLCVVETPDKKEDRPCN